MRSHFVRATAGLTAVAMLSVSVQALAQGYLPPQDQPPPVVVQQPPPPNTAPPITSAPPAGGYVVPVGQPQPYYSNQPYAVTGPRMITDWNEGEPIPPGYHPAHRARGGLIGGGAGMFGAAYLISLMVAAFDCSTAYGAPCDHHYWPLWIPVVGPILTVGTSGSDGTGTAALIVDTALQVGGVAMLGIGIMGRTVLVRNDLGQRLELQPMMAMGATHTGHGAGLSITF